MDNELELGDEVNCEIDEIASKVSSEIRRRIISSITGDEIARIKIISFKKGYKNGYEKGVQDGHEEGSLFAKLKDKNDGSIFVKQKGNSDAS